MATVRNIIERALKRIGEQDAAENVSGIDADDALDALNDMIYGWAADGVQTLHQGFALSDTFLFFVPPKTINASVLDSLAYQGTWDANANSPSLAGSVGTEGYVYKVGTAGSTDLDDVTSWSVGDFAIFDGEEWLKGQSSRQFEGAVVAMLAMRLVEEYGDDATPILARDADRGWSMISAQWVKPYGAIYDTALIRVPSKRYYDEG